MAFTASYKNGTLVVSVSKEEFQQLIVNGYFKAPVSLGKVPADAGNIEVTLSPTAQEVLKQIYQAERAVYDGKSKPTETPKPEKESEDKDVTGQIPTTGNPTDAADNVQ